MEQIETEFIESSEFYTVLKENVFERIHELKEDLRLFDNIERSRGLFPYEKGRQGSALRALRTNENFMLLFNPKYEIYTRLQ